MPPVGGQFLKEIRTLQYYRRRHGAHGQYHLKCGSWQQQPQTGVGGWFGI